MTQNTHHFSDAAGRYALSLFEISREENILEDIEKNIPLGRVGKPKEIASVIEFLISDRNTYMTGTGIDINGGQFLTG